MIPRTVQMAKQVKTLLTSSVDEYGNVIGPVGQKGWSNRYHAYLLGDSSTLGQPLTRPQIVRNWVDGQPMWANNRHIKFQSEYGTILYPTPNTPVRPPLTEITI